MITTKEIAALAGVSRGTVDRVLHNRSGVSKEARDKVIKIVNEQNYRPSRAGMALSQKKSYRIGVILRDIQFFDEVVSGMYSALDDFSDFEIDIDIKRCKGFDLKEQKQLLEEFSDCDGIVVAPINHKDIADIINQLNQKGCPVVAVNSDVDGADRLCYVGCDYIKSGMTAGELALLVEGCKNNVLCVIGSHEIKGHNQRFAGFEQVVSKSKTIRIVDTIEGEDSNEVVYDKVLKAFESYPDIDIVYFATAVTSGGVKAIEKVGKTDRVMVIASDSTEEVRNLIDTDKIKATICQQPFLQGYNSIKVLLSNIIFKIKPDSEIYTQNEIKVKYNI